MGGSCEVTKSSAAVGEEGAGEHDDVAAAAAGEGGVVEDSCVVIFDCAHCETDYLGRVACWGFGR